MNYDVTLVVRDKGVSMDDQTYEEWVDCSFCGLPGPQADMLVCNQCETAPDDWGFSSPALWYHGACFDDELARFASCPEAFNGVGCCCKPCMHVHATWSIDRSLPNDPLEYDPIKHDSCGSRYELWQRRCWALPGNPFAMVSFSACLPPMPTETN